MVGEARRVYTAKKKKNSQFVGFSAGLLEMEKKKMECRLILASGAAAMIFWKIYIS